MRLPLRFSFLVCCTSVAWSQGPTPWAVYYSDKEPPSAFAAYRLLVLDSAYHPPLAPLTAPDRVLLGYISLAEVERSKPYFKAVKAQGILMGENPNWPGSFYVDVRDARWQRRVLDTLIPEVLKRGFHGLFLDTLDDCEYLEQTRRNAKGMTQAAADLVKAIRRRYPNVRVMMNRAYSLLGQVGGDIDYELAESSYADYNFETKTYGLVDPGDSIAQWRLLKDAQARYPRLEVYTLDYWNPEDVAGISKIYREQRSRGFLPYVATVELDRLIREPNP